MNPTPGPWEAVPQPDGSWMLKTPSRHHRVGNVVGTEGGTIVAIVYRRANLEKIARAVNCHEALLEACETLLPYIKAGESGPDGFTVVFPSDVDPFIVARAIAKAATEAVKGGAA